MGEVILTMKDIDKSFVGVHALKNACLELKKGEVHALMGENGAGKSTLMKILTGIYSKDSGVIMYEGRQVEFKSPREAQDAGIVIVHQELNMMNHLTVAQNIFIGKEKMNGKLINDRRMVEEAEKLFGLLNIRIDPRETMGRLTVGRQQMCEIAKAISTDAKIIVFDEPTAALTDSEISELFKIIRDLRAKDIGIIYISHRMDEINQITDRVTVMRDGEYVGTLTTKDSTKDDIIQMMVGRTVYEEPKSFSNVRPDAPVVLKVEHLNVQFSFRTNLGVQLPQRTRGGVPGIGHQRLAPQLPQSVEFLKYRPGHIDLPPNDQPGQPLRQRHGDGADGPEVLRHILPHPAVAPGGATDEHAVPVLQRHGQSVHLGLYGVGRGVAQLTVHPLAELRHLFIVEHILQALQRHRMGVGLEPLQDLVAHPLGGGIRGDLLRVGRLQLLQTAVEAVVLVVRDDRRVQHVVQIALLVQILPQLFHFLTVIHGFSSV